MKYLDLIRQTNESLTERMELVIGRVEEIASDASETGVYASYFKKVANYILLLHEIITYAKEDKINGMSLDKAKELNVRLFKDINKEIYEISYANPKYAVMQFGEEAGQILSALYYLIRNCRLSAFEGSMERTCIYAEFFVEIFNYFEDETEELHLVKNAIYSFMHDYTEVFNEDAIARLVNPDFDYYMDIDTSMLY